MQRHSHPIASFTSHPSSKWSSHPGRAGSSSRCDWHKLRSSSPVHLRLRRAGYADRWCEEPAREQGRWHRQRQLQPHRGRRYQTNRRIHGWPGERIQRRGPAGTPGGGETRRQSRSAAVHLSALRNVIMIDYPWWSWTKTSHVIYNVLMLHDDRLCTNFY